MNEVYMDVPAVRGLAKNFGSIAEVLNTVSKILESLMLILNTTAFIGAVGGAAVANYIDAIKPHIDRVAAKCDELMEDINAAATAFENGDLDGERLFAAKYGG
jgi:uncharacterized protein YukE